MIAAILMAAALPLHRAPPPVPCVKIMDCTTIRASDAHRAPPSTLLPCSDPKARCYLAEEVCGADLNRPDLTVCIAGPERHIRLFMPYPPCETTEAKTAPVCAEWKIGRPW